MFTIYNNNILKAVLGTNFFSKNLALNFKQISEDIFGGLNETLTPTPPHKVRP